MDPTILKHSSENIKVFVRCRPFFTSELSQSSFQSVSLSPASCEISLISPNLNKPGNKIFSFDGVFDYTSDQEQIYELCAFSLVESVFEGYNATIFAYGQTGSGKTYSMMGMDDSESLKGIIPRSFEHIMKLISSCSENKNFMITASFLEIYNEDIHDLLIKPGSKCELRETPDKGFFVKDLTQTVVNSVAELLRLLAMGNKHRVIGETKMNDKSSRSHTIFNIRVESSLDLDPNVKPKISVGKMNLVDLAGSERQNKTQSTDQRFKEAVKINLSLSALGNVISALADGKFAHIPYRDSKLTKLLQDSLGGNSKTIMLANINPNPANYEETLGTLRYASRTKMIKNKPKMNEDPKDALIRNYLDEINKLKSMLEDKSLGGAFTEGIFSDEILKKIKEEGEEAMKEKQKALGDLQDKEKELEEKGKMIGELIEKEGVYEKIRLDKEKLEQLLLEKERNLLQGNHAHEDNSKLEAMRKRIKKQKKIQEDLKKEKDSHEQELRLFERKYASVQEELESLRKTNRELYDKFSSQRREIDDLNREHEYEKENLLDTIREQAKELSYYEELTNMVFSREDLIKIRGHVMWSEYEDKYRIPPFIFKDKEIKFPNLTYSQGIDLLEDQKTLRKMEEDFDLPEIENNGRKEEKIKNFEESKEKKDFLINQKLNNNHYLNHHNNRKGVNVRPVKIMASRPTQKDKDEIIKKHRYQKTVSIEDMTTPSLRERTKMKQEYLRALDNMIETYADKYSKDKIILPQNMTIMNSLSFTDFKDLESNLDIQMIKAKKNLNGLLEPLAYGRNDEVIKELIENNPLLKQSSLIEKNSALINRRVPLSAKTVVLGSLSKGLKKNESGLLKYKGNI